MRYVLLALALALAACTPAPETTTTETTTTAEQAATETTVGGAENNLAKMPPWDGARAAGVDFRGVGQEPGWMLDIYQRDKITFVWDYGQQTADFPLGTADTAQEGATRYSAQANNHTLAVTIRRAPCQDAMSGEDYPSTVEVVIDGATLRGCGKSV